MMIQCGECAVWQHAPCVGINQKKHVPKLYYCEECRPENHPYTNSISTTLSR